MDVSIGYDAGALANDDIETVEKAATGLAERDVLELADLLNVVERLCVAGKRGGAEALLDLWAERTSTAAAYVAHYNLGVMLSADGDFARSADRYRQALELKPDLIQARLNLGSCLEQLGRPDEALAQWRLALSLKTITAPVYRPLLLHVLNNLGRLLEIKRQFPEALRMLEKSLELDPNQLDVRLHQGYLRQRQCLWPLNLLRPAATKEKAAKGCSPLAMLSASNDPELQLAAARWFVQETYGAATETLAPIGGYRHDKIRIGYLSSDFCMHAVSLLMVELFELHDRDRFEVYGFCWSREDGFPLRERVVKAMDHFVKIGELSDREAAACIRSKEIDILIELKGLTVDIRPLILSYRPAPVQMTYLGFPGTTGLPWVDYVIADRYLIPEESARFFTEKPLYLPNCFQASNSRRAVGEMPSRAENGLPGQAFVFCSFNNNYKYTPELFAVWMRILREVPGSVLWLLADNDWARENLRRTAKKLGVKKDRLIFAPRVTPDDYLARYQLADLFLDTFPFNGGTTANDALFMGLPLLTLSGRTFASRMAGSLLTHLNLPELIATSMEEYREKAVRLAGNGAELRALKGRLLEAKASGPVFDSVRFAKGYEDAIAGTLPAGDGQLPATPGGWRSLSDGNQKNDAFHFSAGNSCR